MNDVDSSLSSESAAAAAETNPQTLKKQQAQQFEESLPGWQRAINQQCESWLFAVVIALVVRQFFLEPFNIPSASMEPVMYGDPSMLKSDFVVVDKFGFRFSGAQRWGVTVFQYPVPEVSAGGKSTMMAELNKDQRLDSFPFNPLVERNFVKRCVILPGDVFYVSGGDIYLQQSDGSFMVPEKPTDVQAAMFTTIYNYDLAGDYLPWSASAGAQVQSDARSLQLNLQAGSVSFTQPFNNLYVKEGKVRVESRVAAVGIPQVVDVSMTRPTFTLTNANNQDITGNIWNLDAWKVSRLTSADLDSASHGTLLNQSMDELIGDVRLNFVFDSLQGDVRLQLAEGAINRIELLCQENAWALWLNGQEVSSGAQSLVGKQVQLSNCDNRLRLVIDGQVQGESKPLQPSDPQYNVLALQFSGAGECALSGFSIDRDVHYCANGFLADARSRVRTLQEDIFPSNGVEPMLQQRQQAQRELYHMHLRNRGQIIPRLHNPQFKEKMQHSLASFSENDAADFAWAQPLGVNAETALQAPESGYLMFGDNSPLSLDSRNWGWVPELNLRGSVLAVVWWPSRWKVVH